MTTKTSTKSTAKKVSAPTPAVNNVSPIVHIFNESALRALSVYSASLMFSQPQFAAQTTPNNIIGLADLMYKYMQGEVDVNQPEAQAPTFG